MNPLATEFFAALQDLMLAGDPKPTAARKPACRWCGGSGYREDGTPCGGMADEPDEPGDDITLEAMLRNMGIEP